MRVALTISGHPLETFHGIAHCMKRFVERSAYCS